MSTRPIFSMFAGDNLRLRAPVVDQLGVAVDISTASAIRFAFAAKPGATPLFTKTLASGIFVDGASVFIVDLEPADTASLSGVFYYEADVVNSAGDTYTVLSGYLKINPVILVGA